MVTLGYTVLILCALGVVSALLLYVVAQKFKVVEDPRIEVVEKMLPGANCGGCGQAGCRALAEALVNSDEIGRLYCPVAGGEVMKQVAELLGKSAPVREPQVAVVRCGGTCDKRPRTNTFDGAPSCAVVAGLYSGETGCAYGCVGLGDCQVVCEFGAISVNPETGIAEVDEQKCTACGACVKACPRMLIELRRKGKGGRRVYVSCVNRDKGAVARKNCAAACVGCSKCVKVCPFEAISIDRNLSYINAEKCRLCRKCVAECPTGAIVEVNFPPRKPVEPAAAPSAVKPAPKAEQQIPAAQTAETQQTVTKEE